MPGGRLRLPASGGLLGAVVGCPPTRRGPTHRPTGVLARDRPGERCEEEVDEADRQGAQGAGGCRDVVFLAVPGAAPHRLVLAGRLQPLKCHVGGLLLEGLALDRDVEGAEEGREWIDALEDESTQAAEAVAVAPDAELLRSWPARALPYVKALALFVAAAFCAAAFWLAVDLVRAQRHEGLKVDANQWLATWTAFVIVPYAFAALAVRTIAGPPRA
mgnify:CR=1 FL=1